LFSAELQIPIRLHQDSTEENVNVVGSRINATNKTNAHFYPSRLADPLMQLSFPVLNIY
jgi:hypothetical protein